MGHVGLVSWSRREALALGVVASAGTLGFAGSLWGRGPSSTPGSQRYALGTLAALEGRLDRNDDLLSFPEIKAHLVRYPPNDATRAVYAESVPGLLLIDWRCTHLGCSVPYCESSEWFECPCHGARFNRLGEYKFGPPPRGLDRYRTWVVDDVLMADTKFPVQGPPRGADTIGQAPAGPHCVG